MIHISHTCKEIFSQGSFKSLEEPGVVVVVSLNQTCPKSGQWWSFGLCTDETPTKDCTREIIRLFGIIAERTERGYLNVQAAASSTNSFVDDTFPPRSHLWLFVVGDIGSRS